MSAPRTIGRDSVDASKLVLTGGANPVPLALGLAPNEDTNADGVLDAGEDVNGNGVLEHGIWFERWGSTGVLVTIETQGVSRQGHPLVARLSEIVIPRN